MATQEIQTIRASYRLTGFTPLLGSQPAQRAVRTAYISSKAPTPQIIEGEDALGPDIEEKGLTVFLRNDPGNTLCLRSYVINGFFKGALKALKSQCGVANAASKVDQYVFPQGWLLPITRDGVPIEDEDDVLERPLRCATMQGERVTLAASEQIDDPWQIEFSIELLPNEGTAKSKALTLEMLETALNYGRLKGLGQWRNAGHGKFHWERIG